MVVVVVVVEVVVIIRFCRCSKGTVCRKSHIGNKTKQFSLSLL